MSNFLLNLKLIFLNKVSLIILLTSIVFLISEIKLLDRYASVGKTRVIVTAEVIPKNMPLYTLGYLDVLEKRINSLLNEQGWRCRSLNIKVSTHAELVFHDFEMFCEANPFNEKLLSLEKLIRLQLEEFTENKSLAIEHFEFVAYNKDSSFHILLSICYVIILLMTLPWYPLIAKR